MRFDWPLALFLLLTVPACLAAYWAWLHRKRRYAVRYSSLSLIREAMPKQATWRRHLPVALLLASLVALALGAARPHIVRPVAQNRTSIILAIDVSRSMCAIDVEPNRLAVAQDAAADYITDNAGTALIGIVAFASSARLLVPPTAETQVLLDAVETLRTSFGTALGKAQLEALDAIAEINPQVASTEDSAIDATQLSIDVDEFQPDIIVLLTDGASSFGTDPIVAAAAAAERRVRVFTIGFGTDDPTELICDGVQVGVEPLGNGEFGNAGIGREGVGRDSFGGVAGSFGGGREISGSTQQLMIDEPTLRTIAETTGGSYFRAQDAAQLKDVFLSLPTVLQVEPDDVEISVWFTATAFVLLLTALGSSLAFNRY